MNDLESSNFLKKTGLSFQRNGDIFTVRWQTRLRKDLLIHVLIKGENSIIFTVISKEIRGIFSEKKMRYALFENSRFENISIFLNKEYDLCASIYYPIRCLSPTLLRQFVLSLVKFVNLCDENFAKMENLK